MANLSSTALRVSTSAALALAVTGCHLTLNSFEYESADAGMDAGSTASDAGPIPQDAGSEPDSSTQEDAGVTNDAGSDAGPPLPALDSLYQIATGWTHTCVIYERQVYCWGDNEYGQLGNGEMADSLVPVLVTGIAGTVVEISATGYFTCALTDAGAVYCWGRNNESQLGDGTAEDRTRPVRAAPSINDAARVSAGGEATCVLRNDGTVWCWGRGTGGALGNGEFTNSPDPVMVIDLEESTILGIEGSGGHFCVRRMRGDVACWGWNFAGGLGVASTGEADVRATPIVPRGLAGVEQVSAGGRHTCTRTGTATTCWGWNLWGQLGTGSSGDTHTPAVVGGLSDSVPVDLSAGGSHTCVLMDSGAVYCWGWNERGQLGVGDTEPRNMPVQVSGFSAAVQQLAIGDFHSCALLVTGDVACWGANFEGQLGTGTRDPSLTPVIIDVGS